MSIVLPHIERLSAYPLGDHPPEGVAAIKLNQNENPYPPSARVVDALRSFPEEALRRYPDATCRRLREAIAIRLDVQPEQTFCGNGSSEIISLIMKVFVGSNGKVAIPDPSFTLYHTVAASHQAICQNVPTHSDFTIDIDALLANDVQAIVLINPNAPTGLLLSLTEIERLVNDFPGLVVVDEAYIDFAPPDASAIPLTSRYPNLLVLRTFSKSFALCGARVGYCVGNTALIAALEKGKDIYNVNSLSQRIALAALQDETYTNMTIQAVCRTRDAALLRLEQLGMNPLPSKTNFILCSLPAESPTSLTAADLYRRLLERGIYTRHYPHPRLADKLRISIGTDAEMDLLFKAIADLIS